MKSNPEKKPGTETPSTERWDGTWWLFTMMFSGNWLWCGFSPWSKFGLNIIQSLQHGFCCLFGWLSSLYFCFIGCVLEQKNMFMTFYDSVLGVSCGVHQHAVAGTKGTPQKCLKHKGVANGVRLNHLLGMKYHQNVKALRGHHEAIPGPTLQQQ